VHGVIASQLRPNNNHVDEKLNSSEQGNQITRETYKKTPNKYIASKRFLFG
jgi:hypothetical protein